MAQYYKARKVDELVKNITARGETALLVGEAGSGKTSMCEHLAEEAFLPFLRIALDDSATLRDFIGTTQARDGKTFFDQGLLLETIQKPSWILFDEFNSLPPSRLFFMHELLDHRRLFVKELKQSFDVHPECVITLACNPPSVKYSGTNRMNAALLDRCTVVEVPNLKPEEVPEIFDTGDESTTRALKAFYTEMNRAIEQRNIRTVFSLRSVKRIVAALKNNTPIKTAIEIALTNGAMLAGGDSERKAILDVAKTIFKGM